MTEAAHVIECMLLRWADNQNGRTVTFLLPDDGGEHPFRGLKCGPAHGDRLAISVARIADDETLKEVVPNPVSDSESNRRSNIGTSPGPNKTQSSPSTATAAGAEYPTLARIEKDERLKRKWHELPPSQQCAIRCGEEAFWRFFEEEYGYDPAIRIQSADDAAERVRAELHIESRAELDSNPRAADYWRDIDDDFRGWLQAPAVVP